MSLADYQYWIAYKRLELLLNGGTPSEPIELYELLAFVYGAG